MCLILKMLILSCIICIWTALFWSICYWSQEEHPISRCLAWNCEEFTFTVTVIQNMPPRSSVDKYPMRHRGPNGARDVIALFPFAKIVDWKQPATAQWSNFRSVLSLYALVRLSKASTQNYRLIHGKHLFAYWIPCNWRMFPFNFCSELLQNLWPFTSVVSCYRTCDNSLL